MHTTTTARTASYPQSFLNKRTCGDCLAYTFIPFAALSFSCSNSVCYSLSNFHCPSNMPLVQGSKVTTSCNTDDANNFSSSTGNDNMAAEKLKWGS